MLRTQIDELIKMHNEINNDVEKLENELKNKKQESRDIKQAIDSLERIQSKYESKDEEIECEQ